MRACYGKQDMPTLARAQENCLLLTNGLGGYASVTAAYSVNRCDQGILVAAVKAPNERITMVHRMREVLKTEHSRHFLSSQKFAGRAAAEDGYRHLSRFTSDGLPTWTYRIGGITVTRRLCMAWERNTAVLTYTIENITDQVCMLQLDPFLKFAPKETALTSPKTLTFSAGTITDGTHRMYLRTNGSLRKLACQQQTLAYSEDAKDGRPASGLCGCCCRITKTIPAGQTATVEVLFSMERDVPDGESLAQEWLRHRQEVTDRCPIVDPIARRLAAAADDFIVRRDSTHGKTILAGYPLFSDWGRDTMIALPGCCFSTARWEDARSILRTFLAYEKDGLVPNLFPEGEAKPMYNTVDAALLLIDCIWQYLQRTGDLEFVREAWPVLVRIVAAYRRGTHHNIGMDEDGLIHAGEGLDQVTWMDVCINGILPTPRHGKPVEINAYWYNALRIMDALAVKLGEHPADYGKLAALVKNSFLAQFYIEEKGWLRDVISGTSADEQLRCNQIWAVSMPFTMLTPEQERSVVDAVARHLHTPCGLRTLSPEDPEYHPTYGGPQVQRDMAYHQGTTWVYPMGAFYLAWLKIHGNTKEAAAAVRAQLDALEPMLLQGCIGQLPEIYDGDFPSEGKGCFAQAWSVGEMLRVFEAIDQINNK